jgi:transposase
MAYRHEISDSEWERIKSQLPPENHGEGRPSKPNRVMLNGMLWISKTGAPWRDLPERFGPWQTVYARFKKWGEDGTFQRLFETLTQDADMQDVSIDSTSCKAHQHASGAKKGVEARRPTKI